VNASEIAQLKAQYRRACADHETALREYWDWKMAGNLARLAVPEEMFPEPSQWTAWGNAHDEWQGHLNRLHTTCDTAMDAFRRLQAAGLTERQIKAE
jgi:hypothetical protein